MKIKQGFTLAEVLITLVIIGVIAALTIPALLNNTNKEEYKIALKKAAAILQQASDLQYAQTHENALSYDSADDWYNKFFSKRLNIVSSMPSSSSPAVHANKWESGAITFYTADGMAYSIPSEGSRYYAIIIDVNGDKKPNELTLDINNPKDGYVIYLQNYNDATDSDTTGAAVISPDGPAACLMGGEFATYCDSYSSGSGSGSGSGEDSYDGL
ncbi:MAG: type II secretion system protein [Candidatus Gastranaerophilales bacterium]|nr:type II secretion system protein [Candidatus Gastranaerophilales bacterium]